ncbi:MAG: DUF333 domain-containing protein [Elusimicrobia bacterium]|nr:DUF333 domain-containing protein [Elusimicrobiota bacterium]
MLRVLAVVLSLSAPPASSQPGLANPASKHCAAKGGAIELYDVEGGQIGFCRLRDKAAIEAWTLLKGGKTKVAQAFKGHAKLRERIEGSKGADGTADEHCEQAGGRVAELGKKGKRLSACLFLDRSAVDTQSLLAGPDGRPALAALLK